MDTRNRKDRHRLLTKSAVALVVSVIRIASITKIVILIDIILIMLVKSSSMSIDIRNTEHWRQMLLFFNTLYLKISLMKEGS